MRWGVVWGLRGGDGAGLRYRYSNLRRRTVDYRHLVPEAGGKMWVGPRGGVVRAADGELRRWGQRRCGGKLSYDKRKCQYWGIGGGGRRRGRVRGGGNKNKNGKRGR